MPFTWTIPFLLVQMMTNLTKSYVTWNQQGWNLPKKVIWVTSWVSTSTEKRTAPFTWCSRNWLIKFCMTCNWKEKMSQQNRCPQWLAEFLRETFMENVTMTPLIIVWSLEDSTIWKSVQDQTFLALCINACVFQLTPSRHTQKWSDGLEDTFLLQETKGWSSSWVAIHLMYMSIQTSAEIGIQREHQMIQIRLGPGRVLSLSMLGVHWYGHPKCKLLSHFHQVRLSTLL